MSVRLLTTSALLLVLAGPAYAACQQELQSLDKAVIEAETGASTTASGMPATKHQQEVLAGKQEAGGASTAAQTDAPVSPHQKQVLASSQGGGQDPADLLADAKDMAEAGNEDGCMQKAAQLKSMLGLD